jgi:hypothetical protein
VCADVAGIAGAIMSDDVNCFIARCLKCNGLVFASVDTPDHRAENAKEVAKLIRKGYRVDNMPVSEVRKSKFCFAKDCGSEPKKTEPHPQQAIF